MKTATSRATGVVLAAGAGRRLGGPKATLVVDGERLVDRAVRTLRAGGVADVVVVSGAEALTVPQARVVPNPDWPEGMGSSLRAGLAAIPPDVELAAVVLVDQPGLTPAAVRRVLDAAGEDTALVVATYAGRRGHPVVLGRRHWRGVAELARGDVGARTYLQRHLPDLVPVECADVASDADIDTPDDLQRWDTYGG